METDTRAQCIAEAAKVFATALRYLTDEHTEQAAA